MGIHNKIFGAYQYIAEGPLFDIEWVYKHYLPIATLNLDTTHLQVVIINKFNCKMLVYNLKIDDTYKAELSYHSLLINAYKYYIIRTLSLITAIVKNIFLFFISIVCTVKC